MRVKNREMRNNSHGKTIYPLPAVKEVQYILAYI